MSKSFISFTVLFFSATSVYAAPSISSINGTLNENTVVTVNGANFGSHPNNGAGASHLNFKWDNFDNGSLQGVFSFVDDVSLDTSNQRAGSSYLARRTTGDNVGGIGVSNSSSNNGYYTSFWYYMPGAITFGLNAQIKVVRIGQSSYAYPNMTWGKHMGLNLGTNHIATVESSPTSIAYTEYLGNPQLWQSGKWRRFEGWLKPSSGIGANNGQILYQIDNVIMLDASNIRTDSGSSNSYSGKWAVIPYYYQINGDMFVDDVYFDYTLARIEIGDNPSFAYCTRREIQIPISWSANSLTTRINTGAFAKGTTAYLFVIDSNGAPSAGYPITIGQAGTDEPAASSQFSSGNPGNANNYTKKNSANWSTTDENGNIVFKINTSAYSEVGDLLGEYAIYTTESHDQFQLSLKARADEDLAANAAADYDIIFGFQDYQNYYYMQFINNANGDNRLFKVTNGVRQSVASHVGGTIGDTGFHNIGVTYVNNQLKIDYDGATIIFLDNVTLPAGSKVGFGSRNDAASFDNVTYSKLTAIVEDVNGDNKVDINDVNIVRDQTIGAQPQTSAADVNQSGGVDAVDVQKVVNAVTQ